MFDPQYTHGMPQPPQELIDAVDHFAVGEGLINQLVLYIGMAFVPAVNGELDLEDAREPFGEEYDGGNGLPSDDEVTGQMDNLWHLRASFVEFYWQCLGGTDSDDSTMETT